MDAVEMLKGRRSIRKYKDEVVPKELVEEIVEVARYAPSWANYQIARYTFITDEKIINAIADKGVHGFAYNIGTLKNAKNVAVVSFVQGKSGKLDVSVDSYATSKANAWEMFDTGIATQTFCLAAHEKGVGTCIFGVIDDKAISEIIGLPAEETVATVITYGFPDEEVAPSPRKEPNQIMKFL